MNNLVEKYNRPGPRYTSFPPVPFWKGAPSEEAWLFHVKEAYKLEEHLDLYVHVPFCEKLCYYCGCNRTITKNHSLEDEFLELIEKEWKLYTDKLGFVPRVNTLHFGGGTPTFLSPENLKKLIEILTSHKTENFCGSIEIDPRTVKLEHLDVFKALDIKRLSLGIQDFDLTVQKSINRLQPFEMVETLMKEIRLRGFDSINFDVIYGLPNQTEETISHTFELIRKLRPDLIAYYSYAHLPERIKNQRLIKTEELPNGEKKRQLYELGKNILAQDGYEDVGMDHFALKSNHLYQAKQEGRLHRNFMGYVDKKSAILLGLGPTSISDSSFSFAQNEKTFEKYKEKINGGGLALSHGHIQSEADQRVQQIILDLMCNDICAYKEEEGIIPFQAEIKTELQELLNDGLILIENEKLKVTEVGKKFVRNIAMTFDFYLRESQAKVKFSQTI